MSKNIYKSLIIGSIWGTFEASLGYLLHMIGLSIGWLLWYPIAFFFINRSYNATKSYNYVLLTAVIASSLKLINLFFPGRIDYVINPAVAIILEAVSYVLIVHLIGDKKFDIFSLCLVGFTYRIFYLSYVALLPKDLMLLSQAADVTKFVKFMFSENVLNLVLIYSCLFATEKYRIFNLDKLKNKISESVNKSSILTPAVSVFSVILAVIATVVIR